MATSCSLPRLGIDPRSVVLVLGPQLTAQCLGATSPLPPFLSYRAIVEDGIQRALELEEFGSSAERQHKEQLLQSAYELEPGFAAYKVVETLRCHDQYEEWLRELFHGNSDQTLNGDNGLLNHLQSLQRQGARLVYTHYDEVLANALGMAPVTPDDEQQLRRWAEGQPALLHIHGVISKLDSLKLACVAYDPTITAAHHLIQAQFQHRTVVVIGMGDANYAPLLSKLLGAVAAPRASLPIILTQEEGEQTPCSLQSLVLPLRTDLDIHHTVNTDSISLVRSAPTTASINSLLVQLVFKDRESSGETIELLRSINYTSVQHVAGKQHNVVVELDRTDCVKLWKQVFKRASQVEGLLAVVMQDGSTVWLCDEQQQKAMIEDAPPRASSYLPTLLPLSSSSVSMVPSAWTPVLSTSTSTSAFSFRPPHSGVADSRTALPAAAQPLYQTPNHRDILRRIRSENDKLTLEDRTAAIARTLPPRKNGLFVHQKSEPQISIGHPGPQAPIPVPHPAVLMKFDGKQSEHDIEFIDRYQCNNRSAKYSKGVESAVSKLEKARQSTGKNMSFEDKKQKFISDAIKWSQNVSTQLQRLPSTSTEDTGSVIQAEGTEEQRKLLDRHFDQLQASTTLSSLPPLSNFPTFSSIPLSTSSPIVQNGTHSPQFSTPRSSSPPSPSTTSQSIVLGNCGVPILLRSSTQSTPMFVPQLPFISPYSMQTFPSQTGLQPTEPAATKPLDQTVLPSILPGGLSLLNPDQKQQLFMLSDGTLVSAASSNNHTDDNDGALHSKRVLSPNTDWSNFPLKKRRRSTSLPDVMQLANNSIKSAKSSSSSTSSVTISDHADNTSPSSPPGLPMSATSEQVFFQHYNAPVNPTAVLLPTARGLVMAKREPEEEREEDKEGGSCLLSPQDSNLHPAPTGRGPIQLWQFLLDLLLTPSNHHLIHWTGNGYEFQIQRPEDVAHLWGARKNKPRMNYDKLSRGLRYYYSKGIMDKVPGKKLTFKYTCNIEQYIVSRNNQTTPMSRSNHTTPLISSLPATVMNTT